MQTFDRAIAVQRLDVPDADVPDADVPDADVPDADVPDADAPDASGAPAMGSYRAVVDDAWSIAGKPNGGYLLAIAARAALEVAGPGHPHPVAASAAYARPPRFGSVELTVEPVRAGRSTSLLQVRMHQDGATCLEALVTCGRLPEPDASEVWYDGVPAPFLPPEAECVRLSPRAPGFDVQLMGVLSERLDPATAGWASGQAGGAPELRAWVRFEDGREPDRLRCCSQSTACPRPPSSSAAAGGCRRCSCPRSSGPFLLPGRCWCGRWHGTWRRRATATGQRCPREQRRIRGQPRVRGRWTRPATCGTPPVGWSPPATSSPRCGCRPLPPSLDEREHVGAGRGCRCRALTARPPGGRR